MAHFSLKNQKRSVSILWAIQRRVLPHQVGVCINYWCLYYLYIFDYLFINLFIYYNNKVTRLSMKSIPSILFIQQLTRRSGCKWGNKIKLTFVLLLLNLLNVCGEMEFFFIHSYLGRKCVITDWWIVFSKHRRVLFNWLIVQPV